MSRAVTFVALFPLFAKPFLLYCSLARSLFFSFASLFRLARQLFMRNPFLFLLLALIGFA